MTYYIREAQTQWTPVRAKTLEGAKRSAARRQLFQATDLWVGQGVDGRIHPVALRAAEPGARPVWQDVDPDRSAGDPIDM